MHCLILIIFVMVIHGNSSTSERRQTIERVRQYLKEMDVMPQLNVQSIAETNELQNSNKIGLGYNLVTGSPVCYTGSCQMEGFMHPIFKLNYTSAISGSCTSKLIPDHVHLDCLPSTSLDVYSETITTIEQLTKSITDRITISVEASYIVVAFSYSFSKETRYMIDNIVKRDSTSIVSIYRSLMNIIFYELKYFF